MKGFLVRAEDTFVCRTCEREGNEEDRNVEESLDLGNGFHLENVGKFCFLGDMLNGGWRSEFCIRCKSTLCMEEI